MAIEPSIPGFTVRLLGPLEVHVAGEPLPPVHARSVLWLLALLILRHPRPLERDWLAGVLWPESTQEQALANLRQRLSQLRRALGEEGKRLLTPTSRTLTLDLEGADIDLFAFDAAMIRGDQAALEQAIALYRGPLLQGCDEEWVLTERQAREQAYLQAREHAAACALQANSPRIAARHLREVIAVDPLRESAQRGLLRTLAASGDYAAVVQAYRELRLLLRQELNVEPSAETTLLFEQIRQQGRMRPRIGNNEGLPDSERSLDPPHGFNSTQLSNTPTNNLPPALTSFIGRRDEKQQVRQLLTSTRLITLTGAGGCGKTRLALEVASGLLDDFAEGVWLVELAALSDPALVSASVLTALAVRDEPGHTAMETLLAYLRSKHLLLVLDNCEHLVEACARLADTLHRSCVHLTILATSREALRVEGEQPWRVPPMQHPRVEHLPSDEKELAAILLEYDACHLFVERAWVQRPDFRLSGQNAFALAQLCQRLDGIPLALELAAARMRALTIEEINTRLDNRFGLLIGGSRIAVPRQQTLRALIDWSYDLLNEQEKLLLHRLSVFAGGWTLSAAETACADFGLSRSPSDRVTCGSEGDRQDGSIVRQPIPDETSAMQNPKSKIQNEEVLDLLTSLVDKSLVVAEVHKERTRYRLLETVRQYSWDRLLESGESDLMRERHRDYFLVLAEKAEPKLEDAEQGEWLQRLEAEHENLRAALDWSRDAKDEENSDPHLSSFILHPSAMAGLRLVGALWRFWDLRGYLTEGRQRLREALAVTGMSRHSPAWIKAQVGAGALAYSQRDVLTARLLLEEGLAVARELGDTEGMARALYNLGMLMLSGIGPEADDDGAGRLLEESLTIYRDMRDLHGVASVLNALGHVSYRRGNLLTARRVLDESLSISRKEGNRLNIAQSLNVLGNVTWAEERLPAARALYEQSIAIYREVSGHNSAVALDNLGQVANRQGDYEYARACHTESLAIWRQLGSRMGTALALHHQSEAASGQGDYEAAHAMLEEALGIMEELGDLGGTHLMLGLLVANARLQGDVATAWRCYRQMEVIGASEPGNRRLLGFSLGSLAMLMREQGDLKSARTLIEQSVRTLSDLNSHGSLSDLALIAHDAGDDRAALEALAEGVRLAQGSSNGDPGILEACAYFASAWQQPHLAAHLLGAAQAIRSRTGYCVGPGSRADYERSIESTRDALGEADFAAALAEGRVLSPEQAIAEALQALDALKTNLLD